MFGLPVLVLVTATAFWAWLAGGQWWRVPPSQGEQRIQQVCDEVLEHVKQHPGCWRTRIEEHVPRFSADVRAPH